MKYAILEEENKNNKKKNFKFFKKFNSKKLKSKVNCTEEQDEDSIDTAKKKYENSNKWKLLDKNIIYKNEIVEKRIAVRWKSENYTDEKPYKTYYEGIIKSYKLGKHEVIYDDGDYRYYNLQKKTCYIEDDNILDK